MLITFYVLRFDDEIIAALYTPRLVRDINRQKILREYISRKCWILLWEGNFFPRLLRNISS